MRRLVIAGLLLAAFGCGGDGGDPMDPGDDNNDPGSLAVGTFTARIDGQQWTARAPVAATWTGGILALGGSNQQFTSIGFAVLASAPGTYAISSGSGTNALITTVTGGTGSTWVAGPNAGSGSITINTISTTGATGTFQFNMVADGNSSASGTKTVTNGAFNVRF